MTHVSSEHLTRPSFANYVEFLRLFRGDVGTSSTVVTIASEREEFTMAVPLAPEAERELARFHGTVLAVPDGPIADDVLSRGGRQKGATLVFMSRPTGARAGRDNGAGHVRMATTVEEIDRFSQVQSEGFIDDPVERAEWHPWLRAANLRNRDNPACRFLVADIDGEASSVMLTVDGLQACGIYAVTTRPPARRRGLSTRLLDTCDALAHTRGFDRVILQVIAGSDAHGFYQRARFVEDFRLQFWSPAEA